MVFSDFIPPGHVVWLTHQGDQTKSVITVLMVAALSDSVYGLNT